MNDASPMPGRATTVSTAAVSDGARGMISRRSALRLGLLAAGGLLLAACSPEKLFLGDPPQLYRLSAPENIAGIPTTGRPWQLSVERPTASAALDTSRVVLQRGRSEIAYFARANWTDRTTGMMQSLMVDAFLNARSHVSVAPASIGLRPDLTLQSELLNFQAQYPDGGGGVPTIRMEVNARLVTMPERRIVAQRRFDVTQPAAADGTDEVIAAFDAASDRFLQDLVLWAIDTGTSALPAG